MEKKIKLEIVGLSYSQTQTGAYALVLGEVGAKRRLPVIIGNSEAQAIAIELEGIKPSRPLTHDIFKKLADSFSIGLKEVIIYNLVEGVFYAKIICESEGKVVEIDARTSDAIALAVRFECEVFTYEFILEKAGIVLDEEQEAALGEANDIEDYPEDKPASMAEISLSELEQMIEEAIADEDYEKASKIRDEINRRK